MFAALTIVGFLLIFAGIQQQFLNRIIAVDRKSLQPHPPQPNPSAPIHPAHR